jgi:dTDP-4-amino-4,6-dideoxygalactose transaminase
VPLGSSPAGRRFGREPDPSLVAESLSRRLVRLPLWVGMESADVGHVIESARQALVPELLPHA